MGLVQMSQFIECVHFQSQCVRIGPSCRGCHGTGNSQVYAHRIPPPKHRFHWKDVLMNSCARRPHPVQEFTLIFTHGWRVIWSFLPSYWASHFTVINFAGDENESQNWGLFALSSDAIYPVVSFCWEATSSPIGGHLGMSQLRDLKWFRIQQFTPAEDMLDMKLMMFNNLYLF